MIKQMLFTQWKAVSWAILPLVVVAFALPLLASQEMAGGAFEAGTLRATLGNGATWVPIFPALAVALGFLLAVSSWHWDHRGSHIYALSLPISRARYTTMKFGAGAAIALVPTIALLAGSLVSMAAVDLPEGLRAYPLHLTGRFLFATVTMYAMIFALAAGTARTTLTFILLAVGLPALSAVFLRYFGDSIPWLDGIDVGYWITRAIEDFGPFRILVGNWALFDV